MQIDCKNAEERLDELLDMLESGKEDRIIIMQDGRPAAILEPVSKG